MGEKGKVEKGTQPPEKDKPKPSPLPPSSDNDVLAPIKEGTLVPPSQSDAAALIEVSKNGVMLRSLDELLRFARLAVQHQAAPRGMNYGQAAIAIQAGLQAGLGPLGGLSHGIVVNGVFSWRGEGAVALVRQSKFCKPGTLKFGCEGEGESMQGWATAWRVGYKAPHWTYFTVQDAKQAHLWNSGDNWRKYPKRMLQWRAVGLLIRDLFSDIVGGFPLAEEAVDFESAATERSRTTDRATPPRAPDPLLQALNITPESKNDKASEQEPEGQGPFESHEEADKQLVMDDEATQMEFPS